jgi:tRNA G18 (ribose-2'-O)-methylase SpoU
MVIILDNLRSAHNVGSIFRTADAFGVDEIYLCGTTPTPIDKFERDRKDIGKVALGAEKTVPWKYCSSAVRAVNALKKKGFNIISVEQTKDSLTPAEFVKKYKEAKTVFIFGNEVEGVSEKILKISDDVLEIPMFGKKESLNVSVAFGIALFISKAL